MYIHHGLTAWHDAVEPSPCFSHRLKIGELATLGQADNKNERKREEGKERKEWNGREEKEKRTEEGKGRREQGGEEKTDWPLHQNSELS